MAHKSAGQMVLSSQAAAACASNAPAVAKPGGCGPCTWSQDGGAHSSSRPLWGPFSLCRSTTNNVGEVTCAPRLGHKRNTSRDIVAAHIPGGEDDPEIGPQPTCHLGQLGAAHAGHTHISEQDLDLGAGLKDLQRTLAIVGVEHLTAEFLKQLDGCDADLWHILDHQHGNSDHPSNSQRNASTPARGDAPREQQPLPCP